MSGRLDWSHCPRFCSLRPQFPSEGGFAQLFEPAMVMVPNVAQGLPQPLGDLLQCISLEEVQFNGQELGGGEKLPESCGRFPSPNTFQRPFGKENLLLAA